MTASEAYKICLVGAGAMGGAMLSGWVNAGLVAKGSVIIDPHPSANISELCEREGLILKPSIDEVKSSEQADSFEVIILAIKPQLCEKVLPAYRGWGKNAVWASLMAGISIETLLGYLGTDYSIVRVMPNLPASIGAGMTGMVANQGVSIDGCHRVETLMKAVGKALWVETENQIDLVTAISGSGPAYFFLLAEALEEAAVRQGFSRETASQLARATAYGAGQLLNSGDMSAKAFREAVTSPGGTTQAALNVLEGHAEQGQGASTTKSDTLAPARATTDLRTLVDEAVQSAFLRAQELSK